MTVGVDEKVKKMIFLDKLNLPKHVRRFVGLNIKKPEYHLVLVRAT